MIRISAGLDQTMMQKKKRKEDKKLLEMIGQMPCCVCGYPPPSDAHHIRSRGSGGPDTAYNVMPMCRKHHSQYHQYGPSKFFKEYPHFAERLIEYGWVLYDGIAPWHHKLALD